MFAWTSFIKRLPASVLKRLILSVQFLTIIPLPPVKNVSDEDVRGSTTFFPLVGLALGFVLWEINALLRQVLPVFVSISIALATYTLLVGALHLDGLMDTADALGSRKPRDSALTVMKDSRVGAMGVVAAIVVYTGKITVLSSLPSAAYGIIATGPALSRFCVVLSMSLVPSARKNEGLGAYFAQKISLSSQWIAGLIAALCMFLFNYLLVGAAMLVICILATILMTFFMKRRFGGMTGDTYGAVTEIMEWLSWIVGLLVLNTMK